MDLSIVIPAYNESSRLDDGFALLAPTLEQFGLYQVEVIVIDDGSSDDTLARAQRTYGHLAQARFVQQPRNLGKGAALRLGLRLAIGAKVVTLDADMAITPTQLPQFLTALEHHDLVPGTRAVDGRIRYDSAVRTLAGSAFNRLVRHYTTTKLRDTQCGAKGFRLAAGRLVALLSMIDGFAFDVEILDLADRLDLDVEPLFVTWRDVEGSSVHPGRVARSMLRDVKAVARTAYVNPVVELDVGVEAGDVTSLAREARLPGLVLARGTENTLLVLGRDDSLGGLGIAAALQGSLRTATLEEIRGRSYEAC